MTVKPAVFAAWSEDEDVHLSSSSGGIFSELARYVLDRSGLVCGCEWGEDWTPRHVLVSDWNGVVKLRGSKYVPSFIGARLYHEIIDLAKSGTTILFCGTPCQVAGLARISPPAARNNLILVDLVCHGVPSLKSFWLYLEWRFGGKDSLEYFSFRNKELSSQTICAIDNNSKKYLIAAGEDPWFRAAMVFHLYLQRSCFKCNFGDSYRYGDISLGDFWGIPPELHDTKGDSLVLANTDKGKNIVNILKRKNKIRAVPSDYATASKKIRRIKGVAYKVPKLRNVALYFVEKKISFSFCYKFMYSPMVHKERMVSYLRRRMGLLSKKMHKEN